MKEKDWTMNETGVVTKDEARQWLRRYSNRSITCELMDNDLRHECDLPPDSGGQGFDEVPDVRIDGKQGNPSDFGNN